MLPPLACSAFVVTELFVLVYCCPALITMLPAFPSPLLLAVISEPLSRVTDWPAEMLMSPPVACDCRATHRASVAGEGAASAGSLIKPPAPAPVVEAVMRAPLFS